MSNQYSQEELHTLLVKSAGIIRDLVARCQTFEKEAALQEAQGLVRELNSRGFIDDDQVQEKVAHLASNPSELSLTQRALDLASSMASVGTGFSLRGSNSGTGNALHAFEAYLMGQE